MQINGDFLEKKSPLSSYMNYVGVFMRDLLKILERHNQKNKISKKFRMIEI